MEFPKNLGCILSALGNKRRLDLKMDSRSLFIAGWQWLPQALHVRFTTQLKIEHCLVASPHELFTRCLDNF